MDDLISRSALLKYLRDYKWEFAMGSDFSKWYMKIYVGGKPFVNKYNFGTMTQETSNENETNLSCRYLTLPF